MEEIREEPTPKEYIQVYDLLISRVEVDLVYSFDNDVGSLNEALVRYKMELEKWKNHVDVKGTK
jgi:hypothetical protein